MTESPQSPCLFVFLYAWIPVCVSVCVCVSVSLMVRGELCMLQPEDHVCSLAVFPMPVCVCFSVARGPGVHGCVPESVVERLQWTFICLQGQLCVSVCEDLVSGVSERVCGTVCVCVLKQPRVIDLFWSVCVFVTCVNPLRCVCLCVCLCDAHCVCL